MKRFAVASLLVLALASALAAEAGAQEKATVPCTVCGYIVPQAEAVSAQFEGKTYYFCDAGCKAYFDRDPKVFAAGMDFDAVCGMTVEKAKAVKAVHNGRQIYFCSDACKEAYFKNPDEYEMNYDVVADAVKPQKEMKHTATFEGRPYYFVSEENKAAFEKNPEAYVYAMCPVTGKTFLRADAGATMKHEGKTYYFCCEGCMKKFKENPKQYMGKGRGPNYEKCGDKKGASLGCKEETQTAEGCQKAIESGQCPHMKKVEQKTETKTEKKTTKTTKSGTKG